MNALVVTPRPERLRAEAKKKKKKEARAARAQRLAAAAQALTRSRVAPAVALRTLLHDGPKLHLLPPAFHPYSRALAGLRALGAALDRYRTVLDVVCAVEAIAPGLCLAQRADGSPLGWGVVRLAMLSPGFVRPLSTWTPPRRAAWRVWRHLVAHCLHKFDVSAHLEVLLSDEDCPEQLAPALPRVASGASWRSLDLPTFMTKAVAHALSTPCGPFSSAMALLRDAQARAAGLSVHHRALLSQSEAMQAWFVDDDKLEGVFAFLARHPELSRRDVETIFTGMEAMQGRLPSMKGRTPRSLVALCAEAERERRLLRDGRADVGAFPAVDILGGRYVITADRSFESPEYVVTRLDHGGALVEEGIAMRHCVGTYAQRAKAGTVAIFSLRREETGQSRRALTIEVSTQLRCVVQVRGKTNRSPTAVEAAVVRCWAAERQLGLGAHVM